LLTKIRAVFASLFGAASIGALFGASSRESELVVVYEAAGDLAR
jgi:hypothetical protein